MVTDDDDDITAGDDDVVINDDVNADDVVDSAVGDVI